MCIGIIGFTYGIVPALKDLYKLFAPCHIPSVIIVVIIIPVINIIAFVHGKRTPAGTFAE